MARTINPKKQNVPGAQVRAPSAPSAPGVRTAGDGTKPKLAAGPINRGVKGGLARTKALSYKPPNETVPGLNAPKNPQVKAVNPPPAVDPRDSTYWANTAALGSQYASEYGSTLLDQAQATNAYTQESNRMAYDRGIARRDLGESLQGTGAAYSGSHRRNDTEADKAYTENQFRLNQDYSDANRQRAASQADINARLGYGTGTSYQSELLDSTARSDQALADAAANGAPIYTTPGIGTRIKGTNKRIDTLQKRLKNTKSPKQQEAIRADIKKAKGQRRKLVQKRKKQS